MVADLIEENPVQAESFTLKFSEIFFFNLLAVAVVAGDADTHLGELVLDFDRRDEEYTAAGDQVACHLLGFLHTVGTKSKAHDSKTGNGYTVSLCCPGCQGVANGLIGCGDGTLADSAAHNSFFDYFTGWQCCVQHG